MTPVQVTLKRYKETQFGTFGRIFNEEGKELCRTLEERWNGNKEFISCVPKGKYECVKHNGAHFKDVWRLSDVPNRTGVLIHNGNNLNDTQGCILVGLDWSEGGVVKSVKALDKLRKTLPDSFTLVIEDR